ncbi:MULTISPECIES: response regulator [unclassified Oceanispirochaeta]|uniref:response regulator n=1 Tax=unclassified Oceanispirochaeta TaxID=2635722 RepID=UPI000E08DCAB|nr:MULTISPECIES: response regulator [unclassified Oceanispirochaeta]MBF9014969.1 response regulator [Oceanispirochaeta sp. M2]NPD71350.1 response regulator [Oceanispirochaeta sp. M1]RDG33316.1 response regulator [Oceanispirochaeta sp. M1]
MKLLIVDDSRAARMLIKSILLDYDAELDLSEAENGAIAVELYTEKRPDLVFLDLTMPVLDGYGALEKIIEINPKALVVVLTADIQKKSVDRCMELGAFRVLKKLPDKKIVYALVDEIKEMISGPA